MPPTYTMKISRLTVDKLGVKLYDRVSAVIAELVANSYDADATEVVIKAPMGQLLANKVQGKVQDKGFLIEISDNGIGMTPEEMNSFYLKVGAERRNDPRRGAKSKLYSREVMGRKGVGKLAPFGICQLIEVISSGGDRIEQADTSGHASSGYETAHLTLDRDSILSDVDDDYIPIVGPMDQTLSARRGTTLLLRVFAHRWVPGIDDFARQLAQRFGISSADWKITLVDSELPDQHPDARREVGTFTVDQMPNTAIRFEKRTVDEGQDEYVVFNPDGTVRTDLTAGFDLDGVFYPITGWVAYAAAPYRDDLMAGIRIYCHKKIAAQTSVFNRRAGFTGEHDVRSYLTGALQADWLDSEEDLIQTDRRDILWSHEIGRAFEEWGQAIVLKMGSATRDPLRKKAWDQFREVSGIDARIATAFPIKGQEPIKETALELARMIGKTMRGGELDDREYVESVVQLSLNLAPHLTLDEKLREAAESHDSPLAVMTGILKTARIAELSSFGQIASDRVRVIEKVEELKDEVTTVESAFQDLITQAPWLIDPQWSPITANQTFTTLKTEFEKFFKVQTGQDLQLGTFTDAAKRADFVLSNQERRLEIIEIKKPGHKFENAEMDRMNKYVELMVQFLDLPQNQEFKSVFSDFHVTLVCDEEKLSGVHKTAFTGLNNQGRLTWISWRVFLLRTKRVHQSFLDENERQKRDAAKHS